ncbi:hypothetical protein F4778DRAFT_769018 [Xylariomycetidae sp. FL2044]|nr:hypothetical protein F4778DRAFT_769018 [Xylariomycetidae sp. FL2044]
MTPETAQLVSTVTARFIELTFAIVVVFIIGQSLSKRAFATGSTGISISEITMRTWIAEWKDWARIGDNPSMANDTLLDFRKRPTGKHNLYDNTTMTSTWLEAEFGDIKKNWDEHDRIVHQVRLAMPHPGVYAAVNDQQNNIPLLTNPNGLGLVNITASVVSPTVDVLCANLNRTELRPLVYTSWPHARTQDTKVPGQKIGLDDWEKDVPPPDEKDWLNTTVVDDIFKWGSKYGRWPPAFPLYPNDWNMIVNDTTSALNQNQVGASGSLYILGKSGLGDDYTLCQMRSWVSPVCSTRFQIIGNSGVHMDTLCDDPQGEESDSYWRYIKDHSGDDIPDMQVSQDWQNLAVQWRTSMDINGGVYNNNASNARIMTHLALQKPELPASLPSLSEALAVYVSPTLVLGSIRSPFAHYWDHDNYNATNTPAPIAVDFGATMQVYEYASTSVVDAGGFIFFYIVLLGVMLINIYCFYLLVWGGGVVVTDYTDPANNFALAINSPPSSVMAGSCGGGPEKDQTTAPFRIVYASGANHYYFLEAQDRFKSRHSALSTGSRKLLLSEALYEKSYKRLSSRKPIM